MYVPVQNTGCDTGNYLQLMKIEHKKLGLAYELPELRQRDVEDYFTALRALRDGRMSARQYGEEIAVFVKSLPKLDGERFGLVMREFVAGLQNERQRDSQISLIENRGMIARAAARCNWLGDTTEEAVNDMAPVAVSWLAGQIDSYIADSLEVPGE